MFVLPCQDSAFCEDHAGAISQMMHKKMADQEPSSSGHSKYPFESVKIQIDLRHLAANVLKFNSLTHIYDWPLE